MKDDLVSTNTSVCSVDSQETDDLEWEEWDPSKLTFTHHMIAGSFAGMAEHVSIFPLDTLKTHIQCEKCGSSNPLKTWNCAQDMVRKEGIFRLWRGVSAMFMGCIPAHAAYFSVYESMKSYMSGGKILFAKNDSTFFQQQTELNPLRSAICGASAAFAHDIFMTPFDTIKQRVQLGYYRNIFHCARVVFMKEGIRAFYLSLPTTMAMNLPYGMIMVSINDSVREVLNPGNNSIVGMKNSMIAGSIAGAIAAAVTNPLDVVKTKLQTQSLEPVASPMVTKHMSRSYSTGAIPSVNGPQNLRYELPTIVRADKLTGAFQVAIKIFREEGIRGFMRGIAPRMLVHSPSVAVSWTAYESMKKLLLSTS